MKNEGCVWYTVVIASLRSNPGSNQDAGLLRRLPMTSFMKLFNISMFDYCNGRDAVVTFFSQ